MPQSPPRNVFILDDEPAKAERLAAQISGLELPQYQVHAPSRDAIENELAALFQRRAAFDAGKTEVTQLEFLDVADVLIVDFDLRDLREHFGFATGEEIAYFARLFSEAKVIVVLNHPDIGVNHFDLTLQRDRELRADLYVGFEQCSNPGFWRTNSVDGSFLPWNWTAVTSDVDTFEYCVSRVSNCVGKSVLSHFGLLGPGRSPSLEMLGYLGVKRDEDVEFQNMFDGEDASYVRRKDIAALKNDQRRYCRVAAAFLRKWFRNWVLPSQTLIADVPHFVSANPWSLVDPSDRGSWDEIANEARVLSRTTHFKRLIQQPFQKFWFSEPEWLGRPAFLMTESLREDPEIAKAIESFDPSKLPSLSFAEDLSRFVDSKSALEYTLTLNGEQQIRCIADRDRLLDAEGKKLATDVIYSPESLLF